METTIEVTVSRLKIRLLKVAFPEGYQLVCGGRLVMSCRNGVKTAHKELPEYTHDMFPVPVERWEDGLEPDVSVELCGKTSRHGIGTVRACTLLFNARGMKAVESWIREEGNR